MVFVWTTLQNGFDLVDEGYHMLHYKYPWAYTTNVHNYHYLVSTVFGEKLSIENVRLAWFFAETMSFMFLIYSLTRYLQLFDHGRAIRYGLALVVLGGLFTSVHDRILAYNSLSNFCVLAAFSGLLFNQTVKNPRVRSALTFISGLLTSTLIMIKPSAGLGLVIVSFVLLHAASAKKGMISYLLGVLSGIGGFLWLFLPPLHDWWTAYIEGVRLARVAGYGGNLMFRMYAFQSVYFIVVMAFSVFPVTLLVSWLLPMSRLSEYRGSIVVIGHVISLGAMFGLFTIWSQVEYYFELYDFTTSVRYYPVIAIPQMFAYAWLVGRTKEAGVANGPISNHILVLICLVALPAIIIFGAFSSVSMSLYGHLAPLLAAVYLAPIVFWKEYYVKAFIPYSVVFTTVICGLFFVHNYILYPARLLESLPNQVVDMGQGEKIKVDEPTALFVDELRQKVGDLKNINSILHIGNQPGIVYLLGKYQPGTAMYISVPFIPEIEPMNLAYAQYYIENNKTEIETSVFLINAGVHPDYFRKKEMGGVLLSENHVLTDSVYNPYLKREMVINELITSPYTYIFMPVAP